MATSDSSNRPVWGDGTELALPALRESLTADVCVIGLGGSGLACIHELLRSGPGAGLRTDAGRSVVGIDAVGVAAGAAGRNGGFLLGGLAMFHHDAVERLGERAATALYRETLAQIDRMADETPAAVRRTGSLRIAASDEELLDCERQGAAMRRSGLPVEDYDGPEGRGLLFPRDAAFDPAARCRALAARAIETGARLYGDTRAIAVDSGRVTTDRGSISARDVVVAVDGALEVILPELRDRVRSARLQMLATAPAPEVSFPRPVYSRWGLDYWQQLPDCRIALGGFRDVGGDAEWTTAGTPTEAVQSSLAGLLRGRLGVRAAITHRWAATVGYTQSGLPVLEQVRPRVWALGGYSGTGNVVGALCGRAAAERVVAGSSRLADLLRA